jgi:SAM-dependent methyltransferase
VNPWTEEDSATYRAIAAVAVPRRDEMMDAIVSAAPFAVDEPINILELGSGEGLLAAALLERFPRASLTALDGSESMRRETATRLAAFGDRARVAAFELPTLDWWDRMFGVDLIASSLALHHLNDAKKQYFYKAAVPCSSPTSSIRSIQPCATRPPIAGTRSPAGRRIQPARRPCISDSSTRAGTISGFPTRPTSRRR